MVVEQAGARCNAEETLQQLASFTRNAAVGPVWVVVPLGGVERHSAQTGSKKGLIYSTQAVLRRQLYDTASFSKA